MQLRVMVTDATQFARRDIVAEVQAADGRFELQTIYRCLRRMTGDETGSAYHDLEDLGNERLRLRRRPTGDLRVSVSYGART